MSNILGVRLKKLRKEHHITSYKLSELMDIPRSTISQYENGFNQPNIERIVQFANYFNVSTDYLLGNSDERRTADDVIHEYQVITDLETLSDNQKEFVKSFIETYIKNNK